MIPHFRCLLIGTHTLHNDQHVGDGYTNHLQVEQSKSIFSEEHNFIRNTSFLPLEAVRDLVQTFPSAIFVVTVD